jgi:predicted helicase
MSKAKIFYFTLRDEQRKQEKLDWFRNTRFQEIPFERITPDRNGNWINLADTDFDTLLPLADKHTKLAKNKAQEKAVFKLFSLGVVTARDEWVYDFNEKDLEKKVKFFCEFYEKEKARWENSNKKTPLNDFVDRTIKWTEELEAHLEKGSEIHFNKKFIRESLYRPFVKQFTYFDRIITHRVYQNDSIFPIGEKGDNVMICVNHTSTKPFNVLAIDELPDYHFNGDSNCLPFYRYSESGERVENITDWGLERFRERYHSPSPAGGRSPFSKGGKAFRFAERQGGITAEKAEGRDITKLDIFHYVYAVLHNPAYRKKYELNLKREFPRIPFYDDFWQWAAWGKRLMELHLNYESAKLFGLKRIEIAERDDKKQPKVKLKANKEAGAIEVDEETTLNGIPKEAWDYKLGNRSALEWILDQYKESAPKDKTIAEKFNTYRFADYKESVIALLERVCTVSVETVKILREMELKMKAHAHTRHTS